MPRVPRPDDLYRLRIPTEPRLSPDGRSVAVAVQTVAPGYDGYRHALWLVPTDGGEARKITLGVQHDRHPRFSPDGRTLAFLSDRRTAIEEEPDRPTEGREDKTQVHLLPLDGGEARRLTDLPRGVEAFEWSPDGRHLVVTSSSFGATVAEDTRRRGGVGAAAKVAPGEPPPSDYRFIDRLEYMLNGTGFTYDRVAHLWLVDAVTGAASRLTDGRAPDREPAWSPDGTRVAFSSNRRRDPDLFDRQDIHVVDVSTRVVTAITRGPKSRFAVPTWLPDGRSIAALGNRMTAGGGTRNDVWLFAADGTDAQPAGGRNLTARHDLMPGSGMNSDITIGEGPRLAASADGGWLTFSAPVQGSYELWRVTTEDGRLERLTGGRHYISNWDVRDIGRGRRAIAYLRSSAVEAPEVWLVEGRDDHRRLSSFNTDVQAELALVEPVERSATVDGHTIQGWLYPAGPGARPVVVEIHGGPHTLYGWSPMWEWQVLAGAGMSVFACNPRGSEGYGEAFNDANHRDWGPGPMRDVLAGVDGLVADGLADPERLGLTGGSYGGYLTNWIVGHDDRFAAAITCRSVSDMTMLFLTGDISGGEWGELEFDALPWEDPAYYREISPITYAHRVKTPLLIQHSEKDLRTTIGQAEALFTVLRSHRAPVRLMRVPDETHELTRSGTPFRRVENLSIVEGWFRHFLVEGKRRLPPLPRIRAGR